MIREKVCTCSKGSCSDTHLLSKKLVCPDCQSEIFEVAFGFEHTVDADEAKEIIKEKNLNIGIEDFFTWFIGIAKCTRCIKIIEITSIECS